MSESCENCRYRRVSFCRRYAPRPVHVYSDTAATAEWPHVTSMDWCGEWELQPSAPKGPDLSCRHTGGKRGMSGTTMVWCDDCHQPITHTALGWMRA